MTKAGSFKRTVILFLLAFFYGFSLTTLQILFLRSFLALFYGNELSIGIFFFSWLLWTGLGSYLAARISFTSKRFSLILFAFSVTILATDLTLPYLRHLVFPILGGLPNLYDTFFTAFGALFLFGLLSGGLFPFLIHFLKDPLFKSTGQAGNAVYLLETSGAAVGGLITGLVLVRWAAIVPFAFVWAFVYAIAAALVFKGTRQKQLLFLAIFVLCASGWFVLKKQIDQKLWQGLKVVERRSSPYGELVLTQMDTTFTLYQDGVAILNIPDIRQSEEITHYALLLHNRPQNVLLIGGGLSGALLQILKHPSVTRVDYVELDPEIVLLFKERFKHRWQKISDSKRIFLHQDDGRRFLQHTNQKFDVIIVALPDPYTVQLNRFYTRDFFQLCKKHLKANGILSFRITAAENFLNRAQKQYLSSVYFSLSRVFPTIAFLPGEDLYFFAGKGSTQLPLIADSLTARLRSRKIKTLYVQDYFFRFKLFPDRINMFKQVFLQSGFSALNTDDRPLAYFFDIVLWSSKTSVGLARAFEALMRLPKFLISGVPLILILFLLLLGKRRMGIEPFSMFAVGFSLMALELILLIAFQVKFGYLYHQVAYLIAFFMAGMAAGSFVSIKTSSGKSFNWLKSRGAFIHSLFFVFSASVPFLFKNTPDLQFLFFLLALTAGAIGGAAFPILNLLFKKGRGAGKLYAFDLFGSLSGSLFSTLVLIPVLGLQQCAFFVGGLNGIVLIVFLFSKARKS